MAPSNTPTTLSRYSCVPCKRRKIRCDRCFPCSSCVAASAECIPGTRAPYSRRKRNRPEDSALSAAQTRAGVKSSASPNETSSSVSKTSQEITSVPGFGSNLWRGLDDDFAKAQGTQGPSVAASELSVTDGSYSECSASFLPGSPANFNLRQVYPSPTVAFKLWDTFLQNVNPLSKVIHAPSVQQDVLEASRDLDSLSRPSVALIFAIYTAAVLSMKDEDCRRSLGQSRDALLSHYMLGTRQALVTAGIMKTRSFTLLQAFTIYLLSARRVYDSNTVWILTGMAVRMGQLLGLPSNKKAPEISAFDMQMRRRLWWEILLLDGRSAQLTGSQAISFSDFFKFPLPGNLNDSDINPQMAQTPESDNGATEMLFCLLRYETGAWINDHHIELKSPSMSLQDKDKLIDEWENHLELTYLRYCDTAIPLHLLTSVAARSCICKLKIMAHHPSQYADKGTSIPPSEHDLLFATSLKMLEYVELCQNNLGMLRGFAWHMEVYFQLDAFVFMLIELCSQPPGPMVDRAWQIVEDIYRYRLPLVEDTSDELHTEIRKLTLRAWKARQETRIKHQLETVAIPEFITELQSRLEVPAKAAKEYESLSRRVNIDVSPASSAPVVADETFAAAMVDNSQFYEMVDWVHWGALLDRNFDS